MKQIISALLILLSLGASAQRTNESEYVITEFKSKSNISNKDDYYGGRYRIKLFTENGKQHLDIFDRHNSAFQGIITDNDIPPTEIAKSATQYRSTLVHKTWDYGLFFDDAPFLFKIN